MYVQQHLRKLSESLSRVERLTVKLVSHMILAFFTVVIVYPVIWMLFGSLKTGGEFVSNVWGPPRTLAWENYAQAWERALLGTAICNSLFVSLSVVILVTTLAALAGYAFAKLHFRFSGVILAIFVLTLHTRAPTIPLYVLLVKIHATDAHVGLILPLVAAGLPLSIRRAPKYFSLFASYPWRKYAATAALPMARNSSMPVSAAARSRQPAHRPTSVVQTP